MDQDVISHIHARLAELPEDVRRAIQSAELEKHIQSIGAKHALHIDQVADLEDEVLLVMLGFSQPGEFSKRVQDKLRITSESTAAIEQEVNADIFLPIREAMRAFSEQKSATQVNPPAPLAPPTEPISPSAAPKELHPADMMLSEKTITQAPPAPVPAASPNPAAPVQPLAPKVEPPAPKPYTSDPYREPIQ